MQVVEDPGVVMQREFEAIRDEPSGKALGKFVLFVGQDLGGRGVVNRGDRWTRIRTTAGHFDVPPGGGLVATLKGPKVIHQGDYFFQPLNGPPEVFTRR